MSRNLQRNLIPVVDIFAGAGGLGEGFLASRFGGRQNYDLALSIEMDGPACDTLVLRMFFQLSDSSSRKSYYEFLNGNVSLEELYARHKKLHDKARSRVWQQKMGGEDFSERELDNRISAAIDNCQNWVLVGGPPCQAYSTAGRSRNRGLKDYDASSDERHFLYREYLRIIAKHWPSVFVMENVPGILTSKAGGSEKIFGRIYDDLHDPSSVEGFGYRQRSDSRRFTYKVRALHPDAASVHDLFGHDYRSPSDFLVKSEEFGVPQVRNRVILVGIRDDLDGERPMLEKDRFPEVNVSQALSGLPKLRSGLTKSKGSSGLEKDRRKSSGEWKNALLEVLHSSWLKQLGEKKEFEKVAAEIRRVLKRLSAPRAGRGEEHLKSNGVLTGSTELKAVAPELFSFMFDGQVDSVCNSVTRAHMKDDLHRYLFVSAYGKALGVSPKLKDFPKELLPKHVNVERAVEHSHFADRFKVQLAKAPSSTVVSHLGKDGHYFIHPDPSQCRSLTAREAARLQTFPDNYFFCGNRGDQYRQIGNAVPPFLAMQIAEAITEAVFTHKQGKSYRKANCNSPLGVANA